jgi:hypothetical protein
MGSWSVYCGISQLVITSGKPCVFLALKKSSLGEYDRLSPATLPIFGEYDDYGGMENIVEDENTRLIEEHFGCTIHEFCYFFTRGCISDGEDDFPKKLKEVEEIKNWEFMFIDRQVYNFMSSYTPYGYYGKGHLDFGEESILKLIGFTYIGINEDNPTWDPKRYNQEWEFQGKKFYSDGNSLHCGKEYVFNFNSASCNLSDYVEIPQDKLWIGDYTMWQLWEHLDDNTAKRFLLPIIGRSRYSLDDTTLAEMMLERVNANYAKEGKPLVTLDDLAPSKTLMDKYCKKFKTFGKLLCDLVTIRHNLHPMSGTFTPHQLYLTPQCGEREHHQALLEKFAEINKSYIKEYENE